MQWLWNFATIEELHARETRNYPFVDVRRGLKPLFALSGVWVMVGCLTSVIVFFGSAASLRTKQFYCDLIYSVHLIMEFSRNLGVCFSVGKGGGTEMP